MVKIDHGNDKMEECCDAIGHSIKKIGHFNDTVEHCVHTIRHSNDQYANVSQ